MQSVPDLWSESDPTSSDIVDGLPVPQQSPEFTATVTEPTVAELTEAFMAGVEGRRYVPESLMHSKSDKTDMDSDAESSDTDVFSSEFENVHDLQYVFSSDRDTVISFAKDTLGLDDVSAYSQMDIEVANGINEAIKKVSSEFGDIVRAGYLDNVCVSDGELGSVARYDRYFKVIVFNCKVNQIDALTALTNDASFEYENGGWSSPHPFHPIYHELGHAVYEMVAEQNPKVKDQIKHLYREIYNDIIGKGKPWIQSENLILQCAQQAKRVGISYYGLYNVKDFVSEVVAQWFCVESPSELTRRVISLMKGE